MTQKLFLNSVLPEEGKYCLFAANKNIEPPLIQKFYDTQEELTIGAELLNKNYKYDTYFALASFNDASSRKVPNVHKLKSFYIDLDCGEGKAYKTQKEALLALISFCEKFKFSRPTLINSGFGIHAYWVLEEAIDYKTWSPIATQLKKFCIKNGLDIDPSVTSDGARILRIPGTHNHKKNTPKEVTVIQDFIAAALPLNSFKKIFYKEKETQQIPVPDALAKYRDKFDAVTKKILGNNEYSFARILNKCLKGNGCAQIEYAMRNQNEVSEPLWKCALSIAKHCTDKDEAIHILSSKHEGYTREATVEKIEHIKYVHTCETFNSENPGLCETCPHFNKIKTPIVLGKKIARSPVNTESKLFNGHEESEIAVKIPKLPFPYFRGKNGGIYVQMKDGDGTVDEKMIYQNDLFATERRIDPDEGECVVMRLVLPKDGVREFTVPLSAITSKEELRRALSKEGVAVINTGDIMTYITKWVNELQNTTAASQAHTQFGWTKDFKSFVLGDREIFPNKVVSNPPSSKTKEYMHMFQKNGTLEGWKQTANFLNRPGFEQQQLLVGASFGSVLLGLLGKEIRCGAFHYFSQGGGYGKTATLLTSSSVWGEPIEYTMDSDDTLASKMNRGEALKNLPLNVDEVTNDTPMQLSTFLYRLTSGKQRGRMQASSNQERHRGLPWNFIATTTGNATIIDKISTEKAVPEAEALRIFEMRAQGKKFSDKNETDVFSRQLLNHYGHAGEVFVKYILNNMEEVVALIDKVQKDIDERAGLTAQHRFWSASHACTVAALIICKKIELLMYDPDAVTIYCVTELKIQKAQVYSLTSSLTELLGQFFNENYNSFIKLRSGEEKIYPEFNNPANENEVVTPESQPRSNMVGRYETDTHLMVITCTDLKKWCVEKQLDFSGLCEEIIKRGGTKAKKRLGRGTNYVAHSVWCMSLQIEIGEDE
jgi:hypothetical protein